MTIINQLADLKVSNSCEPLASSFELLGNENRLVARGLQLEAISVKQSSYYSAEIK